MIYRLFIFSFKMKNTIKYFLPRLIALLILVILVSLIYEKTLYQNTLKSEGWMKDIADRNYGKKPDIIYFSASPNESHSLKDTDQRTIHQMIFSLYPKYTIEAIDTGSIHAGIFLYALKHLPKDYKPKMVIMDLNLRSFGLRWLHSGLENAMQRNLVYWNDNVGILNRINAALKNYDYIPLSERNEIIDYQDKFYHLPFEDSCKTVKIWFDSLDRKIDNENKLPLEMLQFFGFEITKENKMLAYYDQIVDFCNDKNIELYFVLLPENLEGMEKNAGVNLKNLTLKNGQYLKNHYKNKRVTIIDALDKLNSSYFYESYPTEHYISSGREIIAKEVVKVLKGH